MCVPPTATLRNGPRPSRISRVIVRVDTNVTTKETKHRISGSLPAAITAWCHHESMRPTLGSEAEQGLLHDLGESRVNVEHLVAELVHGLPEGHGLDQGLNQ